MDFNIEERKVGYCVVSHEMFEKLRGFGFEVSIFKKHFIGIVVAEHIVDEARNRPIKEEADSHLTMLLGKPIVGIDKYYDEDVAQFFTTALFDNYYLVMVADEEVMKHE